MNDDFQRYSQSLQEAYGDQFQQVVEGGFTRREDIERAIEPVMPIVIEKALSKATSYGKGLVGKKLGLNEDEMETISQKGWRQGLKEVGEKRAQALKEKIKKPSQQEEQEPDAETPEAEAPAPTAEPAQAPEDIDGLMNDVTSHLRGTGNTDVAEALDSANTPDEINEALGNARDILDNQADDPFNEAGTNAESLLSRMRIRSPQETETEQPEAPTEVAPEAPTQGPLSDLAENVEDVEPEITQSIGGQFLEMPGSSSIRIGNLLRNPLERQTRGPQGEEDDEDPEITNEAPRVESTDEPTAPEPTAPEPPASGSGSGSSVGEGLAETGGEELAETGGEIAGGELLGTALDATGFLAPVGILVGIGTALASIFAPKRHHDNNPMNQPLVSPATQFGVA